MRSRQYVAAERVRCCEVRDLYLLDLFDHSLGRVVERDSNTW